jgi:hypothetical protein
MKRVLALVGAVALVLGAIAVRGSLDDNDEATSPGVTSPAGDGTPVVAACVPELAHICETSARIDEFVIQDPAETIAAIENGDDIDAWVTFDPWPAIAAITSDDDFFDDPGRIVFSTDLRLLIRNGTLSDACEADTTWVCATDDDPQRVAIPSPDTALGVLALGWAAASWADEARPGEPFARQEFELPEFQRFLAALALGKADPLDDMLVLDRAGPHVVAGTSAQYEDRVGGSADAPDIEPKPGLRAATVSVTIAGPAAELLATEPTIANAGADVGLEPSDDPSTGLPNPGLLFALSQEVS